MDPSGTSPASCARSRNKNRKRAGLRPRPPNEFQRIESNKERTDMAMTAENFVKEIEGMTVLELNGLVKALEEKFGVSAAAMAMPAAGGGVAVAAAPAEEEKTEFTVVLAAAGDKIKTIKVVREVTALGLKEAKDLVDGAPRTLKEGVCKAEGANIKKKFEEVGAKVEIK